ncbi:MAG: M3 family oligoendopeptidase [Bdellovibrio sp.]
MEKMAWNIESEYSSLTSNEFKNDFELFIQNSNKINELIASVNTSLEEALVKDQDPSDSVVEVLQQTLHKYEQTIIVFANLSVYLNCLLSVDTTLEDANAKKSELSTQISKLSQIMIPFDNFTKRCSQEFLNKILNHPDLKDAKFYFDQKRQLKDFLLSNDEEALLEAVSVPGMKSWGDLYTKLCGVMKCHLVYSDRTETVGLAQAAAMTRSADEETRKVAWQSIQNAWSDQKETAAAVLNSLAGWRLEVAQKRSHTKPMHFLDEALFRSRIQRETLEALLTACHQNVEQSRKAPLIMAKLMGKKALEPWDILAQSPISGTKKQRTYDESITSIQKALRKIDPSMAEFVKMMDVKRWIEGRVLPNKRNGAYCTGFEKKREPRVFMTFMGTNSDLTTLAHELGHAFHSWSMRDLSFFQRDYPMTLAETASIFTETVLLDVLIEEAASREEIIEFSWGEIENASSLLLNIPARFDFEKNFYDQRSKRALSADELSRLTDEAWTKWYGPTLTKNETLYWATKLHFSFSNINFYNFPYTFGYLFSMSIYARREELGADFMKKYIEILRDTGRMTAEDLIQKHLGEDIRQPEFWQKSIKVVNDKINKFEKFAMS